MSLITRRKALALGLLSSTSMLQACGGADATASVAATSNTTPSTPVAPAAPVIPIAPAPAPVVPAAWTVPPIYFAAGSPTPVDLSTTLPSGVVKGGAFGVSSTGTALPAGMSLSGAGILSLGSATAGPVVDVIFTYVEPGG